MRKKCLPLILTLLLLLSLSACGQKEEPFDSETAFQRAYAVTHLPLLDKEGISEAFLCGGKGYYVTTSPDNRWSTVYRVEQDGSCTLLEDFDEYQRQRKESGDGAFSLVRLMQSPEGALQVLAVRDDRYYLLTLEENGAVADRKYLSLPSDLLYRDKNGNYYAHGYDNEMTILDGEGNKLTTLQQNRRWCMTLLDGRVAVLDNASGSDTEFLLQPIDPKTQELQTGYTVQRLLKQSDSGSHTFYSGFGEYDFYCNTGLSLYGYRLDEKTKSAKGELLVTWLNCDIEGASVMAIGENAEGSLTCITYSAAFGGEMALLEETEVNTDSVQTLTLACRGLESTMAQQILRFNRQNNGYRVEVRDYGAAAVNNGLAAGLDQLTVDLISGNAPDLFCTDGMDVETLLGQNLLEDLWPYIDADTELGGRQGVVEPVFNAMSRDGKLYEVASGFTVRTVMANTAQVGEKRGWTMEAFWKAYENMTDCVSLAGPTYKQETMLEELLPLCIENYIDRENGNAHFDQAEFADLVRFFGLFPEKSLERTAESSLWCVEGRQLMQTAQLRWAFDFLEYPVIYFDDNPVTYIGYPGAAGNGSAFWVKSPVAMCTKCENKDAAWMFLRTMLLPESQNVQAEHRNQQVFPTNKAVYNLMIQQSMQDQTIDMGDGTRLYSYEYSNASGQMIGREAMTQQQADDLWDYLNGITVVWRQEENLSAILKEEITRFLAGQQDADAAANAVQSRVQLYLDERK